MILIVLLLFIQQPILLISIISPDHLTTYTYLHSFYPESFTVDMNGKRWPWEAVTLLPFIDSAKLIEASRSMIDESVLTEEEKRLNEFGKSYVFQRDPNVSDNAVKVKELEESEWGKIEDDENVAFQPQLHVGTKIPGLFPTLKDAPVTRLNRRKVFLNVFGLRSRYRTALLEMDDEFPPFPPTALLAEKFIGTTVNFRYPILYEGFVCSVSDATTVYRGNEKPHKYSSNARMRRPNLISKMFKELQIGEGMTGTGGWVLPQSDITLTVRPLEAIKTLPDGTKVKVYAQKEVEIPFVAALFSPSIRDPRLEIPAKLEKNPFIFGGQSRLDKYIKNVERREGKVPTSLENAIEKKLNSLVEKQSNGNSNSGGAKMAGSSTRSFSTFPAWKNPTETRGLRLPTNLPPQRRSFHSAANMARRGGNPRQRVVGAAGAIAMSAFFFTICLLQANATHMMRSHTKSMASVFSGNTNNMDKSVSFLSSPVLNLRRGGDIEQYDEMIEPPLSPPLEFAHGTTTLSFVFQGGIIAAVDSRASIGNFVGSKTVQKVLPVSRNILGTMAGGAADCSFWIRFLRSEAKMHELLNEGRGISVARASRIISNVLYQNQLDLSVGTMIMGYHPRDGFSIYYVDNTGVRVEGDMFSVGSGSTFALGILDWRKVFSEDLASIR